MQELGCFQLPGIVYRSLQHGAVHYHAATWGHGRGWMAQQWASGSCRHTRCLPSALCSENQIHQVREHLSKVPDTIECEHLPTQVGYDDKLQSSRDPDEDDEHADELPWDGFWQFVQKFFGYANRLLQQLSGWLVSDDLGGKDAGCGGPGLVWLNMVCGCEASCMYCQILWNIFGDGLW